MLLCMKSLTVFYSVLVNSASEKLVYIFPCENSPFEKREASHSEKQRNRKNGCSIS